MAVVILFRVAIALAPVAARIVYSSQPTAGYLVTQKLREYWDDLHDPDVPAESITESMNSGGVEDPGGVWLVTDYTEPFELRKLQWRFSRSPAGGTIEDVDVITFHFIKATGGVAGSYVDGTDLPAVETAANSYFNSIKIFFPSFMHSDQYRWYKDGPEFYVLNDEGTAYVPIGDNPAIRITEVDTAGTSTDTRQLPPQVATSVTEKTSARIHWGRFYLPAMATQSADATGRFATSDLTALLGYTVTFYNACRAASMFPVVWSIQKPERPKKPSGTLPPWPAHAFEVTSIQIDNLFDVIRSRRYDAPTVKSVTALT